MRDQPNDLAGWLMLGRSYVALERVDDAILAYDHARRLDANNVDAMLGLGEAVSLRAGGDHHARGRAAVRAGGHLAPDNPKALCCTAASRPRRAATGRRRAAAGRRSRTMHPAGANRGHARCEDRRTRASRPARQPAPTRRSAPAIRRPAPSGPEAPGTVNLSIAPALKSRADRQRAAVRVSRANRAAGARRWRPSASTAPRSARRSICRPRIP